MDLHVNSGLVMGGAAYKLSLFSTTILTKASVFIIKAFLSMPWMLIAKIFGVLATLIFAADRLQKHRQTRHMHQKVEHYKAQQAQKLGIRHDRANQWEKGQAVVVGQKCFVKQPHLREGLAPHVYTEQQRQQKMATFRASFPMQYMGARSA